MATAATGSTFARFTDNQGNPIQGNPIMVTVGPNDPQVTATFK